MATKAVSSASSVSRRKAPYNEYVLEAEVDFSLAANTLAQNDILEAIALPANCFVRNIRWEIKTVEGAARNFAIGDGSDTDGYITTTTANTLASGHTALALTEAAPNTVTGYSAGKYYSAADTIDILAVTSGGLTTGKLNVKATVIDYNT